MDTETLTREDVELERSTGPAECAHYARKQKITEAYIEGTPIEALCGYMFVPSKDPNGKPVCQACKAVYDDPEAIHYARWGSE
jgi:hypothetical protein